MRFLTRAWRILRDQRGQFDLGGDFGGLGQDISSYLPDPMATSVGPATSFGPVGDGGGGGFDFGNMLSGFGNFAKGVLPVLGAGTGLMGLAQGIMGSRQAAGQGQIARQASKTQQRLAGEAEALAGPVGQFGQQQLAAGQAGQIPPAIQTQINQWRQAAMQQANDFAARTGQGDSQTLASWHAWIDQQAQAMASSYLESEMARGLAATGQAGGILGTAGGISGQAGQTAAGQADSIAGLIAASNQVLARLTQGAA